MTPTRAIALALVVLTLAACASRQPVPVEERGSPPSAPQAAAAPVEAAPPGAVPEPDARAATYTVKRGDTLAQIALDNGLDYREVAAWNNLDNPNLIRVGQALRLTAPAGTPAASSAGASVLTAPLRPPSSVGEPRPAPPPAAAAASARADGSTKSSPKALREPYSERALREVALASNATAAPAVAASPPEAANETLALATPPGPRTEPKSEPSRSAASDTGEEDRIDWAWPVKGKVVGGFSESANLKGIDIAGTAGQPVQASASGRVVYAGSGLRGYGKLIIIKHNKTYLSAYAHNRDILVKEGDEVKRGQKIAEMGSTDSEQVKLHFEIRRMGKPMDPARYLPPA
ncbi:MAG: peptidoglycan DD-metalloendopeptidase family protein [Casimicrobiaceae bacterium]